MAIFNRILVAVKELDGEPLPAVLKAAELARAYRAPLELFHGLTSPVHTNPLMGREQESDSHGEDLQQKAIRRLEAIADRLRAHSIEVSVSAVWDFPAHDAILRRAQVTKADLIVASLHAGRHRMRWPVRLTDWELLRLSPVPVLLVNSPHSYRRAAVLAAIDPTHAHGKPLELDNEILRVGKALSVVLRGTLHAVHAYSPCPVGLVPEGIAGATWENMLNDVERSAQARFSRALRPARIAPSRQYLIARQPVDAITEAARISGSAIVVMGAISRSGYKRLLIGNTAERILDELPCDVMVIKPAKFRSGIPRALRGVRLLMSVLTGRFGYAAGEINVGAAGAY